jgi:hypothetical protein
MVTATTQISKVSNIIVDKTEELQEMRDDITRLYSFIHELHEIVYNLKNNIEDFEGLDALSFNDAFGQMRQEYGAHHLFEWRGRLFTTDVEDERNQ